MKLDKRKKLGAYYTDNELVNFLVKKVIKKEPNNILEPSFGDGIFINSLKQNKYKKNIVGIEIDKKTFSSYKINSSNTKIVNKNFLSYNEQKFDAVIGNPPFVRTRFLNTAQKKIAVNYYKKHLNLKSLSDPSIWLLFLYHSISLLNKGGTIAFILPYDFTFVSYAKPIWNLFFSKFGKINIYHTKKRYFKDILQDTIVFIAEDYGKKTNKLTYTTSKKGILEKKNSKSIITINDILKDTKPFKRALLPKKFFSIEKKINHKLENLSETAKFHIGYVSGNKKYFHPSKEIIKKFKIKQHSLIKTIADTAVLKNCNLYTSQLKKSELNDLFYPIKPSKADKNYILFGQKNNFDKQHKTKIRNEWYKVPLIKEPDYLISVFEEFPVMILNDGNYMATNTFLCGYLKNINEKKILLNKWFSSLTKLYIELEVHSLGGGMIVMVPQEVGRIKLPKIKHVDNKYLKKIEQLANKKDLKGILRLGDQVILKKYLKLSEDEIIVIKKSIEALKYWRNPT